MRSNEGYRIADEPTPGSLERFVVNPIWPLFGLMLGGGWLAFPWYVFNGVALGSATLKREILLAVAAFAGAALLALAALALLGTRIVPPEHASYLGLLPVAWKLGLGYALLNTQRRSFALWEHYGGSPRNASLVLVAAFIVRMRLSIEDPILMLVLL